MKPPLDDVQVILLCVALCQIARGSTDNGQPLAAETARLIARNVLTRTKIDWNWS